MKNAAELHLPRQPRGFKRIVVVLRPHGAQRNKRVALSRQAMMLGQSVVMVTLCAMATKIYMLLWYNVLSVLKVPCW
jgi:hypothetical protein